MSFNINDTFKWLHENPELSYNEFETKKYILSILEQFIDRGLDVYEVEPTGIVAIIDNRSNDTIAFRSDMDALEMFENEDSVIRSQSDGVMHACGHDGHMTMLLNFINNIFTNKIKFEKNIMFIFQPSEEVDGGARLIIESDIYKKYNPQYVFGIHLWPEIESGVIGLKCGAMMSTNYVFDIEINGKSAHVCTPMDSIDPMQVVGEIVDGFNFLVTRSKGPFDPIVYNIGKINGGYANNTVMEKLCMSGTVRATDDNTLRVFIRSIENILTGIESKYGCKIEIKQTEISYPVVNNDPKLTNEIINELDVLEIEKPSLASEDFGFYNKSKCVFAFLGTRDENHKSMLHTNSFSFDLSVLNKGVEYYEFILTKFGN